MSTILERLEYGFDRDSRRTWRKRSLTTGEDNAYGYDGLSQVVNAARGNLNLNATAIGGVPAEAQAWDYDPTGNWRGYETQTNGNVALDQSRVHDKGNRLTQIVAAPNPVLLDRAGRMRKVSPDATGNWNQSQNITWDAWSRVVRIEQNGTTTGSYAYDGLTRRITRTAGGVTWHSYYSDAWRPLEERQDNQTVPARQYYWGARHRDDLVRRDRAKTSGGALDETRYVLMDYFSPAAITDETGTVKERYAFSAFGVRRILTPTFGDRATSECDFTFSFQGQFLDTESGFLNYGYRYYSPNLGRWLCKDPIGEEGGFNLYASFNDSPVNLVDLLGLMCCESGSWSGTVEYSVAAGVFALGIFSGSLHCDSNQLMTATVSGFVTGAGLAVGFLEGEAQVNFAGACKRKHLIGKKGGIFHASVDVGISLLEFGSINASLFGRPNEDPSGPAGVITGGMLKGGGLDLDKKFDNFMELAEKGITPGFGGGGGFLGITILESK